VLVTYCLAISYDFTRLFFLFHFLCYSPAVSEKAKIFNFCIIAHIDHGKSTLADRMLELTGTVEARRMKEQLLDSMELERERGITIKLQPVRMQWQGQTLNLIDTPGHVDFQYEVSRSLQAVEGAILLVDATQGVQAQTLSNLHLALAADLKIIPVINKIDLAAADVPAVKDEIVQLLGGSKEEILSISAKTGEGVGEVLDAVLERVPPARAQDTGADSLRALIFDSVYDNYKGVVAYVRVVEGQVKRGDEIMFMGTNVADQAVEAGIFKPELTAQPSLAAGEIGYIATGLKDIQQARVGDTIARKTDTKSEPLAGFVIPQPKVFAGLYPVQGDEFPLLREAVGKLQLNDASFVAQQEQSEALGQGFSCGFLGMLHLEIVQERLKREYGVELVVTAPSVKYRVTLTNGEEREVRTPTEFPDPSQIEKISEQLVAADIIAPADSLGPVFELMQRHEGELLGQEYLRASRTLLKYRLPLRELVVDLYDQLKSATSGFGSLSYELTEWRDADVVKLTIIVNHDPVPALATIVPRTAAESEGRRIVSRLKDVMPRQQFAVPLQAAVGGNVVARETLPAMRKNVTGHLYGGDVTRKRKLLEKQKKGKKRLASQGSVTIPPEAYLKVLKR
jgi:GTP-binding protein LepA